MRPNSQEDYRLFCKSAPADFPLFMQDWYLDAICTDGTWDAIVLKESGVIIAVWPFFLKKKLWWEYVAMPLLGKMMGPYLLPECRSLSRQMNLLEQMIGQLPSTLAAFQQDFNYSLTNWLPFYWKGFQQTTRYSYCLDLQQSESTLWKNISNSYRKKIEKATEKVNVCSDQPVDELYRLCQLSFTRQGIPFPLSKTRFQHINDAFTQNQSGRSFFAVDKTTGAIHSAAILVWDQQAAYYLMAGDDPQLRSSGSGVLLQWKAIQFAQQELKLPLFDFEGSMIKAVEQGKRDFGAYQQPYFRIKKEWSPLWRWGKLIWRN
jgi:hypothetical protein